MATEDKALWNRIKPWALLDIPQYVSNSGLVGSTVATDPNAAPKDAPYLTLATNATLTNERVLTVAGTTGLTGTDGGVGGNYTISVAATLAGAGLTLSAGVLDIGAGNGVTVAADSVAVNQAYAFAWSANHTHANSTTVGTASFASGFAGSGWRVDQGISVASQTSAEFDNLTVRGQMRVYELVIHKIRVSLGSLAVSPGGGKVDTVTGSGPYTINFLDAHGLVANDLLRAQKFTGTGTYTSSLTVTSVTDSDTVVATLNSGSAPLAGYEYASIGNTSNTTRQGMLYLTADDSNAPFMDILDGVASHGDWGGYSKTKVRLGKLTGITDSFYGTLSGYGLYTNNAYLRNAYINGSLVIGPGVGFSVSPTFYAPFDTIGNLTVNTNGHSGQRATITGGVHGGPGKFRGGAVAVAQGMSNRIPNPRFAHGTWNTGWAAGGNCTAVNTSDAMFGTSAAQLTMASTENRFYSAAMIRTSTGAGVAMSAWVKCIAGTTAQVKIGIWKSDFSASNESSIFTVGSDWTYIYHAVAGGSISSWSTSNNILVRNDDDTTTKIIVLGAAQAEESYFTTPIFDGGLGDGFSWASTAHNSVSTRTASALQYSVNYNTVAGSIGAWIFPSGGSGGANTDYRVVVHSLSAGYIILRINPSNLLQGNWNGTTIAAGTVTPYTWSHVALTSDGTTARLYLNGALVGSAAAGAAALSTIYVGSFGATDQWINGYIDELFFTDKTLSDNDITALYNTANPVNITRGNFELVLSDTASTNKVVANSGGIYGTSASYKPNFTLLNSNQTVNSESLGEGDTMLGDNTAGKANLLWDNSAGDLLVRRGTTTRIKAGADGVLSINDSGGAAVFTFDASAGAEFTKVLSLGTNGGIWQGSSGTFSAPNTGFKLYKSGSDGYLDIWNAGDISVRIAPDEGVIIRAGSAFATNKALNFFTAGGTRTGAVYSYTDGSTYNATRVEAFSTNGAVEPVAYLFAGQEGSSGARTSRVLLYACKFTSPNTILTPSASVELESDIANDQAFIRLYAASTTTSSSMTLDVTGVTVTNGIKAFKIDHPVDPDNKWLVHAAVESDGNKTCYEGSVRLDDDGKAIVELPAWFDSLNHKCSIQLTPFGLAAPGLHVSRDVDYSNTFAVAGGAPRRRVDWFIQATRRDPWAKAHPLVVEMDKDDEDVGMVAAWREHGMNEDKGLFEKRTRKRQAHEEQKNKEGK